MNPQEPNNTISTPTIAKQSNLTVILMAVFVILSLSAVVFLYYQNQQLKRMLAEYQNTTLASPEPTATAGDPTSDWKTYTNNIYRVSFRYPNINKVYKCAGESTLETINKNGVADGDETECVFIDTNQDQPISLDFTNKNPEKRLSDYIKNTPGKSSQITIDGKSGYLIIQNIPNNNYKTTSLTIFEISNNKIMTMSGPYETTESKDFFDQILSTFKFLDDEKQVACTMEAKICPDGSSVGRSGPNCEFSPCPTP